MTRVLQCFEIMPVYEAREILLALLQPIIAEFRECPQRIIHLLLVHPVVKLLRIFIEDTHDAAIPIRIFGIQILHLRQRLQKFFCDLHAFCPFRWGTPSSFLYLIQVIIYASLTNK